MLSGHLVAGSESALKDMRVCVERADLWGQLCESLQAQLELRLLQLGASTDDIIKLYINLIKAIRIVEPSGVTLEKVAQPTVHLHTPDADPRRCPPAPWLTCGNDPTQFVV